MKKNTEGNGQSASICSQRSAEGAFRPAQPYRGQLGAPTSSAVLEDFTAHTFSVEQMADVVAGLQLLQALGPEVRLHSHLNNERPKAINSSLPLQSLESSTESVAASEPVAFLERFQVIDTLGSGGYGTVLKVRDRQLDREVAIKIYTVQVTTSAKLQRRFLAEAQALAELEHPCIVPIYDVGIEGGLWYLVMKYCPGPTLGEWLRQQERHVKAELAASIVAELASVVHYAHSRGRLHRDIKPSNVLLEPLSQPADEEFPFSLLLSDFGLSRRTEPRGADEQSSDVAGTLWYMAPEQTQGNNDAVSVQSDVYGLGAVLYESLVGQPPFAELSAAEWWRTIGMASPPPIQKYRTDVPADLAAICAKCLEPAPTSRYVSAQELEQDLQRFLRREPVTARPIGSCGRVIRWCRRKPVVASLTGILACTFLASATGTTWLWRRERAQRIRADRREAIVRDAIETYTNVTRSVEAGVPGDTLRAEMLDQTADFYLALADEESQDPQRQYELNVVLHQAANVQAALGHNLQAIATRRRCLAVLEALQKQDPDNPDYQFAHFQNLMILGTELSLNNDPNWRVAIRGAHQEVQQLVARFPANFVYLDALTASAIAFAEVEREEGRSAEAVQILKDALERATVLHDRFPKEVSPLLQSARLWDRLGTNYKLQHRLELALESRQRGVALFRGVMSISQNAPEHSELLVLALTSVSDSQLDSGDVEGAQASLQEGLTLVETLIAVHPDRAYLHENRVDLLYRQANVLQQAQQDEGARRSAVLALSEMKRLMREMPDRANYRLKLADMLEFCPVIEVRNAVKAKELRAPEFQSVP